jgi:ribosomal protein S18 acetylase RimI-like enzyme
MNLIFAPINIEKDLDIAFEYLMDSFRSSFGEDRAAWPPAQANLTKERHHEDLRKFAAADPRGIFHVWFQEKIVGQLELKSVKAHPDTGYVSLYYLIPELRGMGLAAEMDKFAKEELKKRKYTKAQLTVSATNHRAQAFYKKQNWRELGPHPTYAGGILMETSL